MKKNERKLFFFGILLVLALLTNLVIITFFQAANAKSAKTGPKVLIINVAGAISFASAQPILKTLETARENNIKGIILHINSPGGTASSSQEIYNAILRLKSQGIKVITSMGDVAASGGYYIASASDIIYANPSTLTGSIGVIVSGLNFSDIMKKYGIKAVVYKSGKMKDILSPYRNSTKEEQEYLQKMVLQVYSQFFNAVYNARKAKISKEKLKEIADGRIINGEAAFKLGLVDKLGGLSDAKAEMRKVLKSSSVNFVSPGKNFMEQLLKRISTTQAELQIFKNLKAPFLYYYTGGRL